MLIVIGFLKNYEKDTNLTQWRDSPRGPRPTVPNSAYTTLGPEVHEQMLQSGIYDIRAIAKRTCKNR
ncbi:hypothetical protein TNCV_2311981 [Trichonephila clavipes]|nr:hypothetical protein TNCV_2311981 [Trichonephila clavipes]